MAYDAPRAKFVRAHVELTSGDSCRAEVEIESQGVSFKASAQGGIEESDQLRAVARATSDALSAAFEAHGTQVLVIGAKLVETGVKTAVVVSLAASMQAHTKTLLGVADGGDDPATATALAVLNATNRFLGRG